MHGRRDAHRTRRRLTVDAVLAWLTSLPPAALYVTLGVVAALENFVPPIPADVIVAFGSFLAARKGESPVATTIAVVVGNVGGALVMFMLGRRFGAEWIHRKLRLRGEGAEKRVRDWYGRFGLPALFLSRFLPGVRAVVPPLAGAIRVPAPGAIAAISIASTLWYSAIALLAHRIGSDWDRLVDSLASAQKWTAIVAGVVVGMALVIWLVRRQRRS